MERELLHDISKKCTNNPDAENPQRACYVCLKIGVLNTEMLSCGRCKTVIYCSKACQRKEWTGPVSFVKTTAFARPKDESPNVGHGHHWFGNAESYFLIGDALGAEMIRLLKKKN